MKKQIGFILLTTVIIAFIFTVGDTSAWMKKETNPVVNTFTYGQIDIELAESDTQLDNDSDKTTNSYVMDLIEKEISKDAKITVKANSEDCWLFVRINESENFGSFLSYEIENNWKELYGYTNIYYQEVTKQTSDQSFIIFKDNKVTLKNEVTKEELNQLINETYPTISITGYAIQKEAIDNPINAWEHAKNQDGVNSNN